LNDKKYFYRLLDEIQMMYFSVVLNFFKFAIKLQLFLLVTFSRTQKINTFQQETKESVQTALPLRGRLQRPRPNVRRARQRQITEKGEAEGIINEEQVILQKDGTDKKSLTLVSYYYVTEPNLLMYMIAKT
jgi:hypothetical protein